MTDELVLHTMELGPQWPTADPFLFCAHHRDDYPVGQTHLGPDPTSLRGRNLGMDFAGVDGWNMYHGQSVPGFPNHPHRGFETVSYMRTGFMDHSDSLGAQARFGEGDVQWMTAGEGITHCEMFPLLNQDRPNPLEMFQIWINLPAANKMVEPHFSMLWSHDIPTIGGSTSELTVIAGPIDGASPPPSPPHSWASQAEHDVAIWHVRFSPNGSRQLPAANHPDTVRTIYVFHGGAVRIGSQSGPGSEATVVAAGTGAVVRSNTPITIEDTGDDAEGTELLVLQGRPIGEPVARYGPFVMNDRAGIEQAMSDYQRTQFGGWPWPSDDPNHGPNPRRFARHADGKLEEFEVAAG